MNQASFMLKFCLLQFGAPPPMKMHSIPLLGGAVAAGNRGGFDGLKPPTPALRATPPEEGIFMRVVPAPVRRTTTDENAPYSPFRSRSGGCLCFGLTGSLDKGTTTRQARMPTPRRPLTQSARRQARMPALPGIFIEESKKQALTISHC
jgi:hypothetical protein